MIASSCDGRQKHENHSQIYGGNLFLKKKEILLIGSILAAALLLWAGMSISKKPQNNIRITVDGKEYGVYSLSENQTISINDTNVCEIKDGKAKMISATCPDHLCLEQKAVDASGGSVICLPNKVVIEGENSEGDDVSHAVVQ